MAIFPRLDELDSALLEVLQTDARMTNRDLAAAIGVAPSTALERLRSLRERGVITQFRLDLDLKQLGRPVEALISVRLRPQSRKIIHGFRDFVLQLPETVAVFIVTGEDDMLVHVAVPDTQHLQDFFLDRLTKRPEIHSAKTSVLYEHHQRDLLEVFPSQR